MSIKRMPIVDFVLGLEAALNRKDGYIMGATGQNPKNWKTTSWWFTQYTNSSQKAKALYWREHAKRVWDCNGMSEGLYKDFSGVDINTRARYNYQQWCDPKGKGMIPAEYRVPGAAVFWGNSASDIHHVAYLYKPVKASDPAGDWHIIEARGVMYGVVKTKLLSRKPNFWGLMTKYFDYDGLTAGNLEYVSQAKTELHLGDRILRNGDDGNDVKEMQTNLIRLGYDCGKWGADGDFGDATELAVKAFQRDKKLEVDGEFGPKSLAAMEKALNNLETAVRNPKYVVIVGGNCYARNAPSKEKGAILGVATEGSKLTYRGEKSDDGWLAVTFDGKEAWVSGKYGKLVDA